MKFKLLKSTGLTLVELVIIIAIFVILVSIPVNGIFGAMSLQRILNEQCNSNYSLIDVMLNGDNIRELCRIKQQTITIK